MPARTTGLNAPLRAMFSVQIAAAIQAHAIRRRTYKMLCSLSRGSEAYRLRSLTFDEVRAEISAGNPVGVRIAWQGGGAHFVVIRGFRNPAGFQLLNIADPWYEDSIQDFDDFTFTYLGQGQWTDSFLVGA